MGPDWMYTPEEDEAEELYQQLLEMIDRLLYED